jgi:hypothetical protein
MADRRKPTPRQRDVLSFIVNALAAGRPAPTVRELMALCGVITTNGIICHLEALRLKGFIQWDRYKSRSLRVVGLEVAAFFEPGEAGDRLAALLAEKTPDRLACLDCGSLFAPFNGSQVYCSSACKNRTNGRRHYAKIKSSPRGGGLG